MLLIGGATGTGKSSLATELAYRLGISRITSTDVVRQVMRAFFAPALMPALHYSSFEAGEGLRMPMPDPDAGRPRAVRLHPAGRAGGGGRRGGGRPGDRGGAVDRASRACTWCRDWSRPSSSRTATVVQVMLAIEDEEAHQSHFVARDQVAGGARALDRYLRSFGEIRRIQDYLVARAERMGVPIVDAARRRARRCGRCST